MTQPEKREGTIEWFWYIACLLFGQQGQYTKALMSLNLSHNIKDILYVPWHFVHAGCWTMNDLACHFHSCGLRTKDANTLFFDFTCGWLGRLDQPPKEPNWNKVPVPHNIESRGKAHKQKKDFQKCNCEKAALESFSGNWGVPGAPVPTQVQYNESPPLGEAPQLGANKTAPPTGKEPQPEANTPMSVDPPAGGNPDSLEEDLSQMTNKSFKSLHSPASNAFTAPIQSFNAPQVPSPASNTFTAPIQTFNVPQVLSPQNTFTVPTQSFNAPQAPSPASNAFTAPIQSFNAPQVLSPQLDNSKAFLPLPSPHEVLSPVPEALTTSFNVLRAPSPAPGTPQATSSDLSAPSPTSIPTHPIVMSKATSSYTNHRYRFPGPVAPPFNQDMPGDAGVRCISEIKQQTQNLPAGKSSNDTSQKESNPIAAKKKGKPSTKQAVTDNSMGPKNLFKKHWLMLPGNTLDSEFIKAWANLQPEERKIWKGQSNEMKISFAYEFTWQWSDVDFTAPNQKRSPNREKEEWGAE
ncbi:hypothetical protein M378DRAFT_17330 [Amanita muscaria Koide BX008]|uniref:Uncharacterized protein n=1 Tax=Amanita muscaria (strain Koide BX008) TaxID=946122 RepID=A0A0C2S0J8_AMAMK|nr:hypothetical protein M378DRAFT_17330 [Amanita muscaria Koide BX008]